MFPQYTQGYAQPTVNSMVPQYQGVPQGYQQYQQPQTQQTQWNNAPLANQPVNVTQTGIPFDQIRQDLANMIMQNGNRDALAQLLYNETSFNNFQSGAMDKLVTAVALTVDYDARINSQMPLQQIYGNALKEVYDISWATRIQKVPEIANNPANAQLVDYCNQMIQLGQQRHAVFQQTGMLNQRPVQPVPSYQMNNGYNNGYPQYGQINRQSIAGSTTPSPMYQQTAPQYNNFGSGMRSHGFQTNDEPTITVSTVDKDALSRALSGSKYSSGEEQVSSPQMVNNFTPTMPSNTQPRMPELPNGSLANSSNVVFGEQVLKPQPLEQGVENDRYVQPTEEVRSLIKEVDISSPSFWASVQQDEQAEQENIDPRKFGLKEDEIRYLTRAEAKALIEKGLRCEKYHPFILVSADPMRCALHFILTTDNKIRQAITKLDENGVQMERSIHDDVLKPIRESDMMKRAVAEGKHRRFMTTTTGGVVYDRFASSRIVLPKALKAAQQRIIEEGLEGEEKQKVIDEAFAKYKATFEKELEQDYNGVAQYIANNTPEDSEEEVLPNEIDLPMEEREERMEGRLKQYPEVHHDEITTLTNVFDTTHRRNYDTLVENIPDVQDAVIHDVFEPNEIIKVFNTPEERNEVIELLKPFIWQTEPTDEYLNDQIKFEPAKILKSIKGKLPSELYERINLYGTTILNKSIKYIFGSNATVDDFAEDYDDFMDWVYKNDKLTNKAYCMAFLELTLRNALRCLTENPDISMNEDGVDLIEQRALVKMNCFQNTTFPVTAGQLGLRQEDITINEDTHLEVYHIVRERFQQQALSNDYTNRDEPYAPITASFLTFAAGEKYRIWPALQLVQETENDFDIDSFTLEYMGNGVV